MHLLHANYVMDSPLLPNVAMNVKLVTLPGFVLLVLCSYSNRPNLPWYGGCTIGSGRPDTITSVATEIKSLGLKASKDGVTVKDTVYG